MALIDEMELVTEKTGTEENLFITVRDRSITFSKQAVAAMGYPSFVHMYIERKKKRAAFTACDEDEAAIPFYKEPKKGRPLLVRIFGQQRIGLIAEISGIAPSSKGIRFSCRYIRDEATLIVDLSKVI